MKHHLRTVTNSEMSCYRRCQMEHFLSYVQGYRATEDAEALRVGTLIHLGLEQLWLGNGIDAAIEAAKAAADEYEGARVRVMLRGYEARWGDELRDQVVGVEQEFRASLVNPESGAASRTYQLGGKLDVLLRDGIVEHKTASREIGFGSTYWHRLSMDGQVSTYFAGARSLGVEPRRCIYDVLRKPAQRPVQVPIVEDGAKVVLDANGARVRTKDGKKWRETGDAAQGYVLQTRPETPEEYEQRLVEEVSSSPDKYYQRGDVVRLEEEQRLHAHDVWLLTQSMRETTRLGLAVRNPDACERHSRMCGFFPVCSGEASIDDPARYRKVENVHQELTPEAAQ